MTLVLGEPSLIVTPLRALSAQTERSFQEDLRAARLQRLLTLRRELVLRRVTRTRFAPREIIIATPEKLDFALRSDPCLIDDVGLIVLDEGHMIGPSEREIRYETRYSACLRAPMGRPSDRLSLGDLPERRRDPRRSDRLDTGRRTR